MGRPAQGDAGAADDPADTFEDGCAWCGAPLRRGRWKYCSSKCGQEHWRHLGPAPDRPAGGCAVCGVRLTGRQRQYCSPRCDAADRQALDRDARRAARADRVCIRCGAIFTPGRGDASVCSRRCGNDLRRERWSAARWPRRACACCGTEYQPLQARQRHCSKQCRVTSGQRNRGRACAWCGATFRAKAPGQRFCGKSCGLRARWAR